jgi:hypothetical protein
MRINLLYKGVLVAATLCVAPAALPAAPKASQPGATGSSEGAFPITASNLLRQVQDDALSVRDNADRLRERLGDPSSDWELEGDLLERVRDRVNEMDKLLSQLRENQAEASPWQQKAIERIAPSVVILTDTTDAAIASLNDNLTHPSLSNLPGLTRDIYDRASQIARATREFEQYANARHEVRQLEQTLKLNGN